MQEIEFIHVDNYGEYYRHFIPGKTIIFAEGKSRERMLADIECTQLVDDEMSSNAAIDAEIVITVPPRMLSSEAENQLVTPPRQCVVNRMRENEWSRQQAEINISV